MAAIHMHRRKTLPLVNIISFLIFMLNPLLTLQTNDVQSYLDALNTGGLVDINHNDSGEKRQVDAEDESMETWGIPDQIATVGRLFKYTVPKDLFKNQGSVKIVEIGSSQLPNWMTFDESSNQLLGVPKQEHMGKQHYLEAIETKAQPITNNKVSQQQLSKDMFSVSVVEDKVHLDTKSQPLKSVAKLAGDNNELERILCPLGSSVTKATIIVDVNMQDLLPKEMVTMIEKLGEHLNMPSELLRMVPVENKPIFDNSALVAGPGDIKDLESPGAFLQWEVGCGNVQQYHMPILQQLETSAGDGSMSKSLGKGIGGWHITNNRPPTHHRLKRRVHISPTPVPLHRGPSKATGLNDIYDEEEASGFFTDTPPIEVQPGLTSPTVPIRPTKTRKPGKTRKPRPNKTTGRHHRTRRPKPTDPVIPTTPIISPTQTATSIMPTSTSQHRHKPTPELPIVPKQSTDTSLIATPPLPDVATTPQVITTQPIQPSKTKSVQPSIEILPIPTDSFNSPPQIANEIKEIEIRVGDILEKRVPANTFFDEEDGSTRKLKLRMSLIDGYNLSNNSWVQFNQKKQTIYGIPMEEHLGTYQYKMIALDKESKLAIDEFKIKVLRRQPAAKKSHEFSMLLDLNYDRFIKDVSQRFDVSEKLAHLYGDKDMSMITVTNVTKGSVHYFWTNNSLPTDDCPLEEISSLLGFMLNQNDSFNEKFVKVMAPYKILGAGVAAKGNCIGSNIGGPFSTTPSVDDDNTKIGVGVGKTKTSDDDQFITTIVPVVVITTMLLIALIVICCLYRRKRKGKMSDEDNSTFVTKGIPVIFADELEDKPDPPTKPLIMSEEKPPLPPPEYPRSNSGGSIPSSPGSGHKEPLLDDDERYTRPPGIGGGTGTGRRLPKTPNQTSYRQPPPYTSIPP